MKNKKSLYSRVIVLTPFLLLLFFAQGCAVKLVADYDAQVAQEIIKVSKQVDAFYGQLIETNKADRGYEKFKTDYINIEVNIRALIAQNKVRPLNGESVFIAETTLSKWLKYKDKHKGSNLYKVVLAKNHRKRFTRLFIAMMVAEGSKPGREGK